MFTVVRNDNWTFRYSTKTRMRLCIIQPALNVATETFIRAHAERLPARVTVLHGANSGRTHIGNKPVLSQSFPARAMRKLGRKLMGRPWEWEITTSILTALRRVRPHAVLAQYGTTGVLAMEACRLAGVPLVVHFHGFDASLKSYLEKLEQQYHQMFGEAVAIVAVSNAMREQLISLGAAPEKVRYCPYGVDCDTFQMTDPTTNKLVFLSVGRFVEKKGPLFTIRAFAQVQISRPDARLRMIGDGPLLEPARRLAKELGLGDVVTFLGEQSHQFVQRELKLARVFVQHSVEARSGDSEGTPVSIIEAGASGLPVISTRHAGIPDVVIDGETGLLVSEGDVAGMARAMRRICDDPDWLARMGKAARLRIEQHFSIDKSIDNLWDIIRTSVNRVDAER